MARTVEDKYKYNKSKKNDFAGGYCLGVDLYKKYVKLSSSGQESIRTSIDNFMLAAKKGDQLSKGVIAGYRDAANDRKSRKTPLS